MSVIEDVRKVVQDLVTPDLKAQAVLIEAHDDSSRRRDEALAKQVAVTDEASKLRDEALAKQIGAFDEASKLRDEALAKQMGAFDEASKLRDEALSTKIQGLSEKLDRDNKSSRDRIDSQFNVLLAKIESNHAATIFSLNIDKRIEALERDRSRETVSATS